MDYLLALGPLLIGSYTLSLAVWLWRQQNKRGAVGTVLLTLVTLAVSFYSVFLRQPY
ncbi:hypothetical protein [Desulforamulus hydrothermalis]|nr:hypothetical protein [Desulforamulus hydrothermalis]SHG89156.1 hypothetical protein SAMN02745177_00729 [Desulforamulus hydrothermalis Lam5 = DSM 18033]